MEHVANQCCNYFIHHWVEDDKESDLEKVLAVYYCFKEMCRCSLVSQESCVLVISQLEITLYVYLQLANFCEQTASSALNGHQTPGRETDFTFRFLSSRHI